MWIELRKKFLLPLKWKFKESRKEKSLVTRSVKEVLEEYKVLKQSVLDFEKVNNGKEVDKCMAKIELIEWFLQEK